MSLPPGGRGISVCKRSRPLPEAQPQEEEATGMSREWVSRIRSPRATSREGALERLWGVAVCADCGTTIVRGESVASAQRSGAGLCSSCQARPAVVSLSVPIPLRVEGMGIGVASDAPQVASASEREAA